jgi:hypothetical protein
VEGLTGCHDAGGVNSILARSGCSVRWHPDISTKRAASDPRRSEILIAARTTRTFLPPCSNRFASCQQPDELSNRQLSRGTGSGWPRWSIEAMCGGLAVLARRLHRDWVISPLMVDGDVVGQGSLEGGSR